MLKEIKARDITQAVRELCIKANISLNDDIKGEIRQAAQRESWPMAKDILDRILTNIDVAQREELPACQDTGVACVFVELGQEVHIIGGSLEDAINEGVRQGYRDGYLRKSMVHDPLDRINTGDNTPAVIYYDILPGEECKITVAPKGAGSEN